jgi:hypothetical protein
VPSAEQKGEPGVVEKRNTMPGKGPRARSELIRSMVNDPRTPRRRGKTMLF